MIRRVVAVIAALALAFGLAACTDDRQEPAVYYNTTVVLVPAPPASPQFADQQFFATTAFVFVVMYDGDVKIRFGRMMPGLIGTSAYDPRHEILVRRGPNGELKGYGMCVPIGSIAEVSEDPVGWMPIELQSVGGRAEGCKA